MINKITVDTYPAAEMYKRTMQKLDNRIQVLQGFLLETIKTAAERGNLSVTFCSDFRYSIDDINHAIRWLRDQCFRAFYVSEKQIAIDWSTELPELEQRSAAAQYHRTAMEVISTKLDEAMEYIMELILAASEKGKWSVIIPGGHSDLRQICVKHLLQLGYEVTEYSESLHVSWDKTP